MDDHSPSPGDPRPDAPGVGGSRLRRFVFRFLSRRLGPEPLPVRIRLWDGESHDFGPDPRITVALESRSVLRPLLTGNVGRMGDAFVAGDISVEGRAEDVVAIGAQIAERIGRVPLAKYLGQVARLLPRRRTAARDAEDVRFHYDVSNDFYRLWLDRECCIPAPISAAGTRISTARRNRSSTTSAASSSFGRGTGCWTSAAAGAG